MKGYIIIIGATLDLEDRVNDALEKGYVVHGSPFLVGETYREGGKLPEIAQCMVLKGFTGIYSMPLHNTTQLEGV